MNNLSSPLRHWRGMLVLLVLGSLVSGCSTPTFSGELPLIDSTNRKVRGEFLMTGNFGHMTEKRLYVRFFDSASQEPQVVFEEEFHMVTDSLDLKRTSVGNQQVNLTIKNQDGTVAFRRAFFLVSESPIKILSREL